MCGRSNEDWSIHREAVKITKGKQKKMGKKKSSQSLKTGKICVKLLDIQTQMCLPLWRQCGESIDQVTTLQAQSQISGI